MNILDLLGGHSIEDAAKQLVKANAHAVIRHVREQLGHTAPVDNDELRKRLIEQFNSNRHIPGEVRKYLKHQVLTFQFQSADKRLTELEAAVDSW